MKLKTAMLTRYDGKHVLCVGCDAALGPDEVTADPEATHDAAAAHALMQTINDCADKIYSSYARGMIEKRADAIMREWGFTDD